MIYDQNADHQLALRVFLRAVCVSAEPAADLLVLAERASFSTADAVFARALVVRGLVIADVAATFPPFGLGCSSCDTR